MCCCWTRPARSRWATARPPPSCPRRASAKQQLADAAQLASLADETPEGRSIVVLAKQRFNLRERDLGSTGRQLRAVLRADPHERRRHVERTRQIRKGAADAIRRHVEAHGRPFPGRGRCARSRRWRAAAARRWWWPSGAQRAGRDRAQGHRQGRHQGALRRTAPHGHQDGDDHRRQPADRRRDRRRGRRRRLPGRGHAGSQAEADPRVPGAKAGWWR